jgi:hypothetical protein
MALTQRKEVDPTELADSPAESTGLKMDYP